MEQLTSYKKTIAYLYGLQGRGIKFGLRNTRILLRALGNPERAFPSIHIAGTNGKGSTASFLASVFMEAGYKTALYTSPHLISFTERIRINGEEIAEQRLVAYVERLRPTIEKLSATFFEATTCIAFHYFADESVDIAVVEAGLGGRLDSTNVLYPLVSVITNVSFDHMEYLGDTLTKIAVEKGGIMKAGVPCVTGSTNPDVIKTLRQVARRKKTKLLLAQDEVFLKPEASDPLSSKVSIKSRSFSMDRVTLGLPGSHQISNAATAVAALRVLTKRRPGSIICPEIDNKAVRKGLERVRVNSGLHGRFERIGSRFLLDVAHNVDGMRSLISSVQALKKESDLIVVFGVLKDKEFVPILELLRPLASRVVAVQPKTKRAVKASSLVRHLRRLRIPATNGRSVRTGIAAAVKLAGRSGQILITGSHYVVGEALSVVRSDRGYITRNRA